jgi:hypothetical protein
MRRTPSPFVGHHHVTRAKFRSLVKYGAVVLAISFFFGMRSLSFLYTTSFPSWEGIE